MSWPRATARVESTGVDAVRSRHGVLLGYSQRVHYSFQVSRARYFGFGPHTKLYICTVPRWQTQEEARMALPELFSTVDIAYDPSDPSRSLMVPFPTDKSWFIVAAFSFAAMIGAVRISLLLKSPGPKSADPAAALAKPSTDPNREG